MFNYRSRKRTSAAPLSFLEFILVRSKFFRIILNLPAPPPQGPAAYSTPTITDHAYPIQYNSTVANDYGSEVVSYSTSTYQKFTCALHPTFAHPTEAGPRSWYVANGTEAPAPVMDFSSGIKGFELAFDWETNPFHTDGTEYLDFRIILFDPDTGTSVYSASLLSITGGFPIPGVTLPGFDLTAAFAQYPLGTAEDIGMTGFMYAPKRTRLAIYYDASTEKIGASLKGADQFEIVNPMTMEAAVQEDVDYAQDAFLSGLSPGNYIPLFLLSGNADSGLGLEEGDYFEFTLYTHPDDFMVPLNDPMDPVV